MDGYKVQLAADGQQALDQLAEQAPDAIVLDLLMQEVDGLEVCRRLRAAGDRIPVLMLTARDGVPDRVKAWTPAPTTISSSRSRWRSSARGCARCCGAPGARPPSGSDTPTSCSIRVSTRCSAAIAGSS